MLDDEIYKLSNTCEEIFELDNLKLSDEYYYKSVVFCIIDAIFSINSKYTATRNTVIRYCSYYNLDRIRDSVEFTDEEQQHTVTNLIENIESIGISKFTTDIVKNRQRTSTKNGILKIEAIYEWAKILQSNNIETLQDFNDKYSSNLETLLINVRGQSSGVSLAYLKMLAGNDKFVKPDRHIVNFIADSLGRNIDVSEVQEIMKKVVLHLSEKYSSVTVRALDHAMWRYKSSNNKI